MIPRLGEPIDRRQRYRLRPGAYVILPRGSDILLTVQHDEVSEIQLPGGGIDPDEPILPALYREVLEETGWSIHRPVRLGAFRRFVYMPEYDLWAEKLCHIYCARPGLRVGPPLEPNHDALWLPMDEAVNALGNDGDRVFLADYLRRYQPLKSKRTADTSSVI